jgi:diacylglycerol kinase family enzyme
MFEEANTYFQGRKCQVVITEKELMIFNEAEGIAQLKLAHADLIGFRLEPEGTLDHSKHSNEESPFLENVDSSCRASFYYYPYYQRSNSILSSLASFFTSSANAENYRSRQEIVLTFPGLTKDKQLQLKQILPEEIFVQKNFLIFVNPYSGPGKGMSLWNSAIQPMLHEANISYEFIVTEYSGHIKEILQEEGNCENSDSRQGNMKKSALKRPLTDYTTIVTVGGDGTYFEVVNGLLERKQKDGEQLLSKISIQPLPTGSGNALNRAILFVNHETSALINAVFTLIRGKLFPKDLCQITYNGKNEETGAVVVKNDKTHKPVHSFLMLGYGIVADLDIYSEHLHFLGELRFYLYAVYYVAVQRQYEAILSVKLSSPTSLYSAPPKLLEDIRYPNPPEYQKMTEENPSQPWITIHSKLLSFVIVMLISHISDTVYFAPNKKFNSNELTIFIGENMTRLELINLLISADTGQHINLPGIHVFHCSEYCLTPKGINGKQKSVSREDGEEFGIYSIDGERYPAQPIQGVVLPNGSRLLLLQTT